MPNNELKYFKDLIIELIDKDIKNEILNEQREYIQKLPSRAIDINKDLRDIRKYFVFCEKRNEGLKEIRKMILSDEDLRDLTFTMADDLQKFIIYDMKNNHKLDNKVREIRKKLRAANAK